jgi:hypothetical protein
MSCIGRQLSVGWEGNDLITQILTGDGTVKIEADVVLAPVCGFDQERKLLVSDRFNERLPRLLSRV